jgi:hypothetical protein
MSLCSLPHGAFAPRPVRFSLFTRSLPGDIGVTRDRRAPEFAVNTFEQAFNREMELATYMKRVDAPVYWQGYTAGLMRGVFGPTAVDDHRHEAWLQADPLGEVERGYRDGFRKLAGSATGTRQVPFLASVQVSRRPDAIDRTYAALPLGDPPNSWSVESGF